MSDLKIFTDNIENEALNQIYTLIKQPVFKDCKVRIMPDVHAGKGSVIGFTANLGDKVIPNVVGVDIGCGMSTFELGKVEIDFMKLDSVIREHVPYGKFIHHESLMDVEYAALHDLHCYPYLRDVDRINRSIGSIGGGNHFCEIDVDKNGNKYLIIHTGSRNLGKQVAEHYQNLAIEIMQGKDKLIEQQNELINELKSQGRKNEIEKAIKELQRKFKPDKLNIPKELCYLEGKYRDMYLHDMKICQEYAEVNRQMIAKLIMQNYGFSCYGNFSTIHNYIDLESNIVRKGAISAKMGEKVLIPINMKDGCIIGIGKGNEDWNQSAPHGAGRIYSRSKCKTELDVETYLKAMEGIYSTCVNQSTLDESPMAYKSIEDIISNIGDTIDIIEVIKPIYNFKASE